MAADLEARVSALEAKVQELIDSEAIRDLRFRYHEYINEAKFSDIASLFTEDGELDLRPSRQSPRPRRDQPLLRRPAAKPDADGGKTKEPRISRVQPVHP